MQGSFGGLLFHGYGGMERVFDLLETMMRVGLLGVAPELRDI